MAVLGLFGSPNIGKLEARRDVVGLIKALTYRKDAFVRLKAARALGNIGDTRAVAPLVAALTDGAFSATPADYKLAQRGQVMLNDTHKAVCSEVVTALEKVDRDWGKSGYARAAVPELISMLGKTTRIWMSDKDYGARLAAVVALGKIGDARAVEPLVEALKEKQEELSYCAIEALSEIGDARAVAPLISALIYGDYLIYKAAMRALGTIDPNWSQSEAARAAVPSFVAALEHKELAISWAAGDTLNMMGVDRGPSAQGDDV